MCLFIRTELRGFLSLAYTYQRIFQNKKKSSILLTIVRGTKMLFL